MMIYDGWKIEFLGLDAPLGFGLPPWHDCHMSFVVQGFIVAGETLASS
jgi:hypothetical protein